MVTRPKFTVGDRVRFDSVTHPEFGIVVEDRGPLGVDAERVYGVHVPALDYEGWYTELPEHRLQLGARHVEPIDVDEAYAYFEGGGLLHLLFAGRSPVEYHHGWLTRDRNGILLSTTKGEFGILGGARVPANAVDGDRIRAGKRDEVVAFLQTFGLGREQAERLVEKVGTR